MFDRKIHSNHVIIRECDHFEITFVGQQNLENDTHCVKDRMPLLHRGGEVPMRILLVLYKDDVSTLGGVRARADRALEVHRCCPFFTNVDVSVGVSQADNSSGSLSRISHDSFVENRFWLTVVGGTVKIHHILPRDWWNFVSVVNSIPLAFSDQLQQSITPINSS